MTFLLQTRYAMFLKYCLLFAVLFLVSCGQEVATKEPQDTPDELAVTDTTSRRPSPKFYIVPPNLAEQRVWICDNAVSDIFHITYDCPLLLACKGKGSFRNVVLLRAIEDYGRYNCQSCSKALDDVFDENKVR